MPPPPDDGSNSTPSGANQGTSTEPEKVTKTNAERDSNSRRTRNHTPDGFWAHPSAALLAAHLRPSSSTTPESKMFQNICAGIPRLRYARATIGTRIKSKDARISRDATAKGRCHSVEIPTSELAWAVAPSGATSLRTPCTNDETRKTTANQPSWLSWCRASEWRWPSSGAMLQVR